MTLFVILCFLGMIVAWIAWYKGRNRHLWWLYGSLLFVVAFPHVLLIDRTPRCPHCGEAVEAEADECANCGREL